MIRTLLLVVLCVGVFQFAHSQEDGREARLHGSEPAENEQADRQYKNTSWYKLMQMPHADFFRIQRRFDRFLKRHPLIEGPRETGEDWLKQNIYYLDSKGRVQDPPAFDYQHLRKGLFPSSSFTDTIAGDWHITGPRNQVLPDGSTRGGFSYCVRMDPTNTQKMFISFQTGGLWVSSDGGVVWHLTDANMPDNDYCDINVCAANTNIVYAISRSAVIKSTDGGYTWSVTGLNNSVSTFASAQGCDIAVSPSNPNIVVARWGNSLYQTTDGGGTWNSVLSSLQRISPDYYVNTTGGILEWSNNDPNRVFFIDAAPGGATATVYSSANQGGSFTALTSITIPSDIPSQSMTGIKITTATDQTSSVFAFLTSGYKYMDLYKIDVSTAETTLLRKNMSNNNGCDAIAMDIKNSSNIVYGTYGEFKVHYSTDNGQTFTNSNDMHYDIRSIHIVGGKVMVGTDGETVVSTDKGASFSNLSAGISNIELWGFSSSFKSDILAAGCNHGPLTVRDYAAPGGWYHLLGADQQNTDINPLDSVHVISRGYDAYYVMRKGIGTYTSGSAQVDPGREDWFNNLSYHPNLYNTLVSHTAGNFPQPYQSNPTGTKLTWRNSLLRSDNNGLTISYLVHTFSDRLMSEKICMKDTNRIYCIVSPSNNHLWKTTDGGTTWTEITPGTLVTGNAVRNISDVAVSDVNPDEIWVTYSGVQQTCKVLHSTDGGSTYANLTTPVLGSFPVIKIIFQRGTNGGVYIGNKAGVFYRNNTMSDWKLLGTGLPMLDVRNMFINYYKGKILIGTSRGAWDHDLYEHSSTIAQISAGTRIPNCQYPTVQFRDYSVVSNGGRGATYSWSFPGGTPSTSNSETPVVSYLGNPAGSYDVTLTVTDQYGTSTQTLSKFITYDPTNCCQGNAPGWSAEDIGNPSIPGTTCYQPSIKRFTVQASGADIWDVSDQFRFNDTVWNGNGQIIAKVVSLTGSGSWTKAGLMFRETTSSNSKYAFAAVTTGNGVNMLSRNSTGGYTNDAQDPVAASLTAPYWVKLIREGNLFSTYGSPDGINWTLFDSATIAMNAALRVGLALTGHDNSQLATAVFDSVSIQSSCAAITIQPVSATACMGSNASFSATVAGSGNTFQWESDNGSAWFNVADGSPSDGAVSGSTTPTLVKTVNAATRNGGQWRLRVNNANCGTILSNPVKLTVTGAAITAQPVSATDSIGRIATFDVSVAGVGNIYQWETNKGSGWLNEADGPWPDGAVTGSATPTLQIKVDSATEKGRQWRLNIINGSCPGIISNIVTLTILTAKKTAGRNDSLSNARGNFSVYPNPTHDVLTIEGMQGKNTIIVYNSAGGRIFRITSTLAKEIVATANWAVGMYVLIITGEDGHDQIFEVIKD